MVSQIQKIIQKTIVNPKNNPKINPKNLSAQQVLFLFFTSPTGVVDTTSQFKSLPSIHVLFVLTVSGACKSSAGTEREWYNISGEHNDTLRMLEHNAHPPFLLVWS